MAVYYCASCDLPRCDDEHGYNLTTNNKELCDECAEDPAGFCIGECRHIWPEDEGASCPDCGPTEAQLRQHYDCDGPSRPRNELKYAQAKGR